MAEVSFDSKGTEISVGVSVFTREQIKRIKWKRHGEERSGVDREKEQQCLKRRIRKELDREDEPSGPWPG